VIELADVPRPRVIEQRLEGRRFETADVLPIPLRVLPSGSDVESMSGDDAAAFHRDADGGVRMGYFPSLMSHSGPLSTTLARTIIDSLKPHFSDTEQQKLAVMADSLSWKQAFGDARF